MSDPEFHDGRYASSGVVPAARAEDRPDDGAHHLPVSSSRWTRSSAAASRTPTSRGPFGRDFAVEHYLHHQGEAFLERFDALSLPLPDPVARLLRPVRRTGATAALGAADDPTRFLVTSFDSDWRFATTHSRRIVRDLERAGCR